MTKKNHHHPKLNVSFKVVCFFFFSPFTCFYKVSGDLPPILQLYFSSTFLYIDFDLKIRTVIVPILSCHDRV